MPDSVPIGRHPPSRVSRRPSPRCPHSPIGSPHPPRKGLFRKASPVAGGYYLDGGFGVGKTHLLTSLWHAVPGPKAYGTFVEYTHLVGALGFNETVRRLSGHRIAGRRRVRAGRSRRHHVDDPAARPAGGERGQPGRDVEHPARQARRGALCRRGFPPRDPCAVSTFRHLAGGRAGLPARRTRAGTAAAVRRGTRDRPRPRQPASSAWTPTRR